MVEPSKVIDDKFRTIVLELTDGRVVSGVIVSQTDTEIRLAANPIDAPGKGAQEPLVIRSRDVAERFPSTVSLMPQGLLNTLDEQEILDLLSFVASGGQ
jgi:putative heme-binding domain-containing protein